MWFTLELIKRVLDDCKQLYPVTSYAFTTIPSYPCGQIGFVLASKNKVSPLGNLGGNLVYGAILLIKN